MPPKSLAVLAWIAVFLLAFELALEVRAVRRGWEGVLLGRGTGWATSGDEGVGPTAAFPFRSPIIAPERRPGVPRVWIASSSYGADLQLPPDQVFPNLLGAVLTEAGQPTETLNASIDGYSIRSNVSDLQQHGASWAPDVAVLYQMSNDIDWISGRLGVAESASVGAGETAAEGPNAIHRLIESTTAFKHLKSQVTARLTRGRVLLDTMGEEGERAFEGEVRAFLEAARAAGAQPVLCTFATSHVRENVDELPAEYEYNLLRFNVTLSMEGWLDSIERNNRVLERVAGEEEVPLVDLAGALAGRSELFRDFWHLKARGHEIAAAAIVAALIDENLAGEELE